MVGMGQQGDAGMGREIGDCRLVIAKLGTCPKGGSQKENLKARRQESEARIQERGKNIIMMEYWAWRIEKGFT
jgi:hypothetical protein